MSGFERVLALYKEIKFSGLIYLIDADDQINILEARRVLLMLMSEEELRPIKVTIVFNQTERSDFNSSITQPSFREDLFESLDPAKLMKKLPKPAREDFKVNEIVTKRREKADVFYWDSKTKREEKMRMFRSF